MAWLSIRVITTVALFPRPFQQCVSPGRPGLSPVADAIPGPEAGRGSSPKAKLRDGRAGGASRAGRRLRLTKPDPDISAARRIQLRCSQAHGERDAAWCAKSGAELGAWGESPPAGTVDCGVVPSCQPERLCLRDLKPKPGSR
jgi:hypothetical protein